MAFEPQESEYPVHRMTVTRAGLAEGDENLKFKVMIPILNGFKEKTNHRGSIVTNTGNSPEPVGN